jgi:hypothetical protein
MGPRGSKLEEGAAAAAAPASSSTSVRPVRLSLAAPSSSTSRLFGHSSALMAPSARTSSSLENAFRGSAARGVSSSLAAARRPLIVPPSISAADMERLAAAAAAAESGAAARPSRGRSPGPFAAAASAAAVSSSSAARGRAPGPRPRGVSPARVSPAVAGAAIMGAQVSEASIDAIPNEALLAESDTLVPTSNDTPLSSKNMSDFVSVSTACSTLLGLADAKKKPPALVQARRARSRSRSGRNEESKASSKGAASARDKAEQDEMNKFFAQFTKLGTLRTFLKTVGGAQSFASFDRRLCYELTVHPQYKILLKYKTIYVQSEANKKVEEAARAVAAAIPREVIIAEALAGCLPTIFYVLDEEENMVPYKDEVDKPRPPHIFIKGANTQWFGYDQINGLVYAADRRAHELSCTNWLGGRGGGGCPIPKEFSSCVQLEGQAPVDISRLPVDLSSFSTISPATKRIIEGVQRNPQASFTPSSLEESLPRWSGAYSSRTPHVRNILGILRVVNHGAEDDDEANQLYLARAVEELFRWGPRTPVALSSEYTPARLASRVAAAAASGAVAASGAAAAAPEPYENIQARVNRGSGDSMVIMDSTLVKGKIFDAFHDLRQMMTIVYKALKLASAANGGKYNAELDAVQKAISIEDPKEADIEHAMEDLITGLIDGLSPFPEFKGRDGQSVFLPKTAQMQFPSGASLGDPEIRNKFIDLLIGSGLAFTLEAVDFLFLYGLTGLITEFISRGGRIADAQHILIKAQDAATDPMSLRKFLETHREAQSLSESPIAPPIREIYGLSDFHSREMDGEIGIHAELHEIEPGSGLICSSVAEKERILAKINNPDPAAHYGVVIPPEGLIYNAGLPFIIKKSVREGGKHFIYTFVLIEGEPHLVAKTEEGPTSVNGLRRVLIQAIMEFDPTVSASSSASAARGSGEGRDVPVTTWIGPALDPRFKWIKVIVLPSFKTDTDGMFIRFLGPRTVMGTLDIKALQLWLIEKGTLCAGCVKGILKDRSLLQLPERLGDLPIKTALLEKLTEDLDRLNTHGQRKFRDLLALLYKINGDTPEKKAPIIIISVQAGIRKLLDASDAARAAAASKAAAAPSSSRAAAAAEEEEDEEEGAAAAAAPSRAAAAAPSRAAAAAEEEEDEEEGAAAAASSSSRYRARLPLPYDIYIPELSLPESARQLPAGGGDALLSSTFCTDAAEEVITSTQQSIYERLHIIQSMRNPRNDAQFALQLTEFEKLFDLIERSVLTTAHDTAHRMMAYTLLYGMGRTDRGDVIHVRDIKSLLEFLYEHIRTTTDPRVSPLLQPRINSIIRKVLDVIRYELGVPEAATAASGAASATAHPSAVARTWSSVPTSATYALGVPPSPMYGENEGEGAAEGAAAAGKAEGGSRSKKSQRSKRNGTRHTKHTKRNTVGRLLSHKFTRCNLHRSYRRPRSSSKAAQRHTQRRCKSN